MHKWLLLSLITLCYGQVHTQNLAVGLSGNIGLSQVTSNLPFSGDYRVRFALSGNAGVFVEHQLTEKSHLSMEVLWVQIEGNEISEDKVLIGVVDGMPAELGIIDDRTRLHSSYIGVPISYRYQMGKWGINAGAQILLFLSASADSELEGTFNGEPYYAEGTTEDIEFDTVDYGPRLGVSYQWKPKLALTMNYYHGLVDITPSNFPWERKNRQWTVGVRYAFHQQ